jgi:hypothetical protein
VLSRHAGQRRTWQAANTQSHSLRAEGAAPIDANNYFPSSKKKQFYQLLSLGDLVTNARSPCADGFMGSDLVSPQLETPPPTARCERQVLAVHRQPDRAVLALLSGACPPKMSFYWYHRISRPSLVQAIWSDVSSGHGLVLRRRCQETDIPQMTTDFAAPPQVGRCANAAALPQARKDGLSSESGATHGTRRGPVNYRQRGVCTAAFQDFNPIGASV